MALAIRTLRLVLTRTEIDRFDRLLSVLHWNRFCRVLLSADADQSENGIRLWVWHDVVFGSTWRCTLAIKLMREIVIQFWFRLHSVTYLWQRDWGNLTRSDIETNFMSRRIGRKEKSNSILSHAIMGCIISHFNQVDAHETWTCRQLFTRITADAVASALFKSNPTEANNSNKNIFSISADGFVSNKRKTSTSTSNQDVKMLRAHAADCSWFGSACSLHNACRKCSMSNSMINSDSKSWRDKWAATPATKSMREMPKNGMNKLLHVGK